MAIYELTGEEIRPLGETSFAGEGLLERRDLQRLLRARIAVIDPDILVIAEEFSRWEDSAHRIDLLGVDREANLVVIELKRTSDGGHMELQALRYAAMVSPLTFDDAVETFGDYLARAAQEGDPRQQLLDFFGWEEAGDQPFNSRVRIVLGAMDFGKELTSTVLWLNAAHGLDIRCVRIKPYRLDGRLLVDVQQLIPLPEAAEYQVKLGSKARQDRADSERSNERLAFWQGLVQRGAGNAALPANARPGNRSSLRGAIRQAGIYYEYYVYQHTVGVWLMLDREQQQNKALFDRLKEEQATIEADFGATLTWNRHDSKRFCSIGANVVQVGYADRESWPAAYDTLLDAMPRLERAFQPHLDTILAQL